MRKKGLTRESVIKAAKDVIEEKGYENFTMHLLAAKLGIKTASLYAHVESIDALITNVMLLALEEQKKAILSAVEDKTRDDAVEAVCAASRAFAKEHEELYKLIMQIPLSRNKTAYDAAWSIAEPYTLAISGYNISGERREHWERVLRATAHGFISQEGHGYFTHYSADIEESFRIAVRCVIAGLHGEEEHGGRQN